MTNSILQLEPPSEFLHKMKAWMQNKADLLDQVTSQVIVAYFLRGILCKRYVIHSTRGVPRNQPRGEQMFFLGKSITLAEFFPA